MDNDSDRTLIGRVEAAERRATHDFLAGDYGEPSAGHPSSGPKCPDGHNIPSSARVIAYHLLNEENRTVGERRLFALVDAVACVLAHDGRYGSEETARLALETVVEREIALAAVRALAAGDH